jgi:hypothetical protein
MNPGPLSATELVILLVANLPWLAGLAVAAIGVTLLRRLVLAAEQIARAVDLRRHDG